MSLFDVDKSELLRRTILRYDGEVPGRSGWTPVHCINPEHPDRNRSASANVGVGRYRCHGCGIGGDGFDLMRQIEGLEVKAAVEALDLETEVSQSEWLF